MAENDPWLVACCECGEHKIDLSRRRSYYQKVEGWERFREGGGTNALSIRRPFDVFMCVRCMDRALAGVPSGQGSLV